MTNDDDRRAAADVVYEAMKGALHWMHAKSTRDRIIAGEWDNHSVVQAFTAHRLAAERRGMERAAGIAENNSAFLAAATIRAEITNEGAD